MTEKFLVTGGSGFIGSHLIDEIARRGFELINLDINPPSIQEQTRFGGSVISKIGLRSLRPFKKSCRPASFISRQKPT